MGGVKVGMARILNLTPSLLDGSACVRDHLCKMVWLTAWLEILCDAERAQNSGAGALHNDMDEKRGGSLRTHAKSESSHLFCKVSSYLPVCPLCRGKNPMVIVYR